MQNPPTITMTSFGSFVAADAMGQLSKVREVKRRYEQEYAPSSDFWSRWREGIEQLHRREGKRTDLAEVWTKAKDNRGTLYHSACDGYSKFWGRKEITFAGQPKPVLWKHDRLTVRVNPEWMLDINGRRTLIKVHTQEKLTLEQRLVNPLLYMLESLFPGDHDVVILDVHRGKVWSRRTEGSLEQVLRMQAAAFLAGWDLIADEGRSAA